MMDEKIKEVLEKHKRWLDKSKGWSEDDRADLRGANLMGADLSEANLREANLREADLSEADLSEADLYRADLREANLREANLMGADLSEADLSEANLYRANLREANLREANLMGADLSEAKNLPLIPYACPDFGIFIGWKKAYYDADDCTVQVIVQLEIPEGAKRLSATGRKCRCDKAKVLSIKSKEGQTEYERARSGHDPDFIYKVGETVTVPDFDEDRWNECSTGIHFFINRQEAVEY